MLSVNQMLYEYVGKNKLEVVLWFLFTILLYPIQHVIIPKYYGLVINSFKDQSAKFMKLVYGLIGFYIAAMAINSALFYYTKYIGPSFGEFSTCSMFNYIMDNYELDFDDIKSGEILSRIPYISRIFLNYLNTLRMLFFSQIFVCLTALYHYWFISAEVFFFFLVALIVNFIFVYRVFLLKYNADLLWYKNRSNLFEYINDAMSNLVSIYSANHEVLEKKQFVEQYEPLKTDEINGLNVMFNSNLIWNVICIIVFLVLNRLIYKAYLRKSINVEQLVSTFTLTFSVLRFYENAPHVANELSQLYSEIGDIDAFFKKVENTQVKTTNSGFVNGDIVYENVYHKYKDQFVLNNVSVRIAKGEKVALVGHIGSGKSTTIKLLMGFLPLTMGDITIQGVSIQRIPNHELRKHIFYIPQKPKLFNRTLYKNIVYGLERPPPVAVILQLLRDLHLEDVAVLFEKKMNEKMGLDGNKLSGGQKQIVWLLRSFFGNTKIVVMDEPLASLDAENKERMLQNILRLCQGKTLILISHDALDASFRKIEFKNGHVVA